MNVVNKTLFLTLLCLWLQGCNFITRVLNMPDEKGSAGAVVTTPPSPERSDTGTGMGSPPRGDTTKQTDSKGASNEEEKLSPLAFQVKYYYRPKEERGFFKELTADSRLFSKDLYSLKITPEADGYLYVYQVGSNSKIQDLMEQSSSCRNRVQKNKTCFLPSETEAFSLDDVPGTETIYVLGFKQRHYSLEKQYNALSQAYDGKDETGAKNSQAEMLKILKKNPKQQNLSFKHEKNQNQEK